jgi:hypothetical protein
LTGMAEWLRLLDRECGIQQEHTLHRPCHKVTMIGLLPTRNVRRQLPAKTETQKISQSPFLRSHTTKLSRQATYL